MGFLIFEAWNRTIFSLVKSFFSISYEGFYRWNSLLKLLAVATMEKWATVLSLASHGKWDIPEKIHAGRLTTWNFQEHWKNRLWKFQGSFKKEVEFRERWSRKNHVNFLWVLDNLQGWNLIFSGISRGKVTNLTIPGFFFKKCISSTLPVWVFSGIVQY